MKKIILIIFLITFSGLYVSAQQRTCGMEEHMEEMMKDPIFAKQWAENQKKFNEVKTLCIQVDWGVKSKLNLVGFFPIFIIPYV